MLIFRDLNKLLESFFSTKISIHINTYQCEKYKQPLEVALIGTHASAPFQDARFACEVKAI
jgi:hypothetical protein